MIIVTILSFILSFSSFNQSCVNKVYPKAMQVIELNYDTNEIVCIDSNNFKWIFLGIEDYEINDLVVCIMDNNCTQEIFDDSILSVQYSGYHFTDIDILTCE